MVRWAKNPNDGEGVMGRDYRREYRLYYGVGDASSVTAEQRRHRREKTSRNEARALYSGRKRGMDIHHVHGNPMDNRSKNKH